MARADSKMKYCSFKCQTSGETNPAFKGGITRDRRGYVLCRVFGPNGNRKGTQYEHRLIMKKQIGRDLHTWEHVHHIDFNNSNNKPSNLMIMTASDHHKLHQEINSIRKVSHE